MRKFLMVAAVGALVLLMSAPVMALDFQYSGYYRIRFYDYTNWGFTNGKDLGPGVTNNTNHRGVETRVRPFFKTSDDNGNIQAAIRFEYNSTWGGGGGSNGTNMGVTPTGGTSASYSVAPSGNRVGTFAGGAAGTDGIALRTKWAYVDFQVPFGIPLRIKAGQQDWYLPNSIIIDDDFSGVKAYGKIDPVSYQFWWFRAAISGGNYTAGTFAATGNDAKDDAIDYYGGKLDFAIAKIINPYVYGFYGSNKANCVPGTVGGSFANSANCGFAGGPADRDRPQYYLGLGATGDAGFASYDIDWVYGYAKGGPNGNLYATDGQPLTTEGWIIQGGVHVPIGPAIWHIVASYATGDTQKNSGHKSDAFPGGPGPSWSGPSQVAGGGWQIMGEGDDFDILSMQTAATNIWTIGTAVDYYPVKALKLRAGYLFVGFSEKSGNCAVPSVIGCFGPVYTGTIDAAHPNGVMAGKGSLGQEIDLRADWTVWTGFNIRGLAAWLVPSTGSTTGKYILQFEYSF